MNGKSSNRLALRRVRLVNFHNLVNETIEIRHGGHLFLLGDNASGKTTILDAVHYALTAGEAMEFNSAARVAGAREDGRRVQGVILRYNVDTGPLNAAGAITYVGIEVAADGGRPVSAAVGMTARSMDEKVQRWGILREGPLEEIPFLVDAEGGRRPATRQEMRDALGDGHGFYGNIMHYQREVAGRLFGGEQAFAEVCRFLSMGKAYREIVSHTADYHQLFRRLLPEPRSDLFEQVIIALRSLDQAGADLRALEEKCHYLAGLRDHIERVHAVREERRRLRWLRAHYRAAELDRRRAEFEALRADREESRNALLGRIEICQREQEDLSRRLGDLQRRDSSGIITAEREQAADLERLTRGLADRRAAVAESAKHTRAATRERERGRERLRKAVVRLFGDLTRLAPQLPFPVTELIAALDAIQRQGTPEDCLDNLPLHAFRERGVEASRDPEGQLAVLRHCREQTSRAARETRERLARATRQEEALPVVAGFAEALRALHHAVINATPLYAGLEWAPTVSEDHAAALEEAIGEDVLATLLVPSEAFETAREIVFPLHPGVRLARAPAYGDLADWIREAFDVSRSDPCALRALAAEMMAHQEPETFPTRDGDTGLRFRSHERRLGKTARGLVGLQRRQTACQTERDHLQAQLDALEVELADVGRREKEFSDTVARLADLRRLLDEDGADLLRRGAEVRRAALLCQSREQGHRALLERAAELAADVASREQRLKDLRAIVSREGLDRLEQLSGRLRRRLDKQRAEETAMHAEAGALNNQIKGILQTLETSSLQHRAALEHMQAEETSLRAAGCTAENIARYVLDTCAGNRFADPAAVDDALGNLDRQEGIIVGELGAALHHPVFGALYGFSYEAPENRLLDRRNSGIHDLVEVQRQQVDEQRELINQKTRELFRRLIVEQLLLFLNRYVRELREMVKRINRDLGARTFGGSRYRFQLQEVERYRRLIRIVEHYNPFEADRAADEVRLFFEDHRDEVMGTEVNTVPDILDYRNWFHYDMRVQNTDDEDGVVMDRRTKSIGSGGEQAVPNYLLILTVADFLFRGNRVQLPTLIFDEAFYGIDSSRRDQILGFATDLGLQLLVASPDQDGVKNEVAYSTTVLVVKDESYDVHLFPYHWENPRANPQPELLEEFR
ncbi:MAG: AAA family ATPase, partial [Lentisphaeria bacterium]|nr:AAA family ATPase [Lentisphaeria bacterium]